MIRNPVDVLGQNEKKSVLVHEERGIHLESLCTEWCNKTSRGCGNATEKQHCVDVYTASHSPLTSQPWQTDPVNEISTQPQLSRTYPLPSTADMMGSNKDTA